MKTMKTKKEMTVGGITIPAGAGVIKCRRNGLQYQAYAWWAESRIKELTGPEWNCAAFKKISGGGWIRDTNIVIQNWPSKYNSRKIISGFCLDRPK